MTAIPNEFLASFEAFIVLIIILSVINIAILCKAGIFIYELKLKSKLRKNKNTQSTERIDNILLELKEKSDNCLGGLNK